MVDKIRSMREKRGLSQGELAKLAGIDRSNLNKIERGLKQPGLKTLTRVAKALNVSIKYFF